MGSIAAVTDVHEHRFAITRIIVETVEVPVRMFGANSDGAARQYVESLLNRGGLSWDCSSERVDIKRMYSVPVWAVDRVDDES